MTIRALPFKIGDRVVTPKEDIGVIQAIGELTEKEIHLRVVYRVNRRYWFDWQLRRIRRKS